MILAKIAGTVVGTQRSDEIDGAKYLLVELCDQSGKGDASYLVVFDQMGAGPGEVVIVAQGSSARQTAVTFKKPIDAIVVGIVDMIDERGRLVYSK